MVLEVADHLPLLAYDQTRCLAWNLENECKWTGVVTEHSANFGRLSVLRRLSHFLQQRIVAAEVLNACLHLLAIDLLSLPRELQLFLEFALLVSDLKSVFIIAVQDFKHLHLCLFNLRALLSDQDYMAFCLAFVVLRVLKVLFKVLKL